MNIKEAEKLTGISKRNIRFYEQKGMLHPARNQDNDYRDYSSQDIERLKLIRALRMVDMPLEEIQKVLDGKTSLEDAAMAQESRLCEKAQEVQTAIRFCQMISKVQASEEVDTILQRMEEPENLRHLFQQWVNDYRNMRRAQDMLKFTLIPDEPVRTPQEFTAALRQYALKNDLELVMTKEDMHPEFTLNGGEYTAQRRYHCPKGTLWPVASIYVTAKHPEQILPQLPQPERQVLKAVRYGWIFGIMAFFAVVIALDQGQDAFSTPEGLAAVIGIPLLIGIGLFVTFRAIRTIPFPYNFKDL